MKKRTALGMVTAVALLAGCSSPTVSTQMGLHAQMDSAPALNSSSGRYRAGTADIALTKIVSLPDDQLGLRFVISAPSLRGGCWYLGAYDCRSAKRFGVDPSTRHFNIGFRVLREYSGD